MDERDGLTQGEEKVSCMLRRRMKVAVGFSAFINSHISCCIQGLTMFRYILGGVGFAVGGVVGLVVAGPAGAAVGASVGTTAGKMAGDCVDAKCGTENPFDS
jgi:hypothetical protein